MPTGETLAVETQAPVPPPPPTPTATASSSPPSTRRRHRTFSSSSSSSSSLSTVSSTASSPSPSPRGRGTTTTSVPFSWEHHPGIPKMRLPGGAGAGAASSAPTPLPLPPPLRVPETSRARHHQHARRRRACSKQLPADDAGDPFAAALAECTRERGGAGSDAGLMDALFPARATSVPTSRRWSIASAGGVVGLLDLYGCKSVMGVAEGAFVVRRPVKVVRAVPAGRAGLGRAGRR